MNLGTCNDRDLTRVTLLISFNDPTAITKNDEKEAYLPEVYWVNVTIELFMVI